MKLRNMMMIFSIFLMLACLGSVCASDNSSHLGRDNASITLESSDVLKISSQDSATSDASGNANTPKKEDIAAICSDSFIKKSNRHYTVKTYRYNEKTNKLDCCKNVKLTVKVKIGKTVKTYHVKTNRKGVAKIFNVKKLKAGIYKVRVKSDDERYNLDESGNIIIYNKKQKTVTVHGISREKKVKGNSFILEHFLRDGQEDKGTYVKTFPTKDYFGNSHSFIIKAKIFLKNKKTGKTITKTIKHKRDSFYGWDAMKLNLIKGYTPYKAKLWYVTR